MGGVCATHPIARGGHYQNTAVSIGLPPTKEKFSQRESFEYIEELLGRPEEYVLSIGL